MVHGRADLHERLQKEQFATDMGTRVIWHDGPAWMGRPMAFGLALGCLTPNLKAFDLSRSLKSRPSIWEIFPWWDLGVCGRAWSPSWRLVLGAHSMKLDETYAVVRAQSSQHKCLARRTRAGLEKEKKELEEKIEAVRKFLDSRILWSAYLRDISIRLPPNVVLELVRTGRDPWTAVGGGAAERAFSLRATAPLAQDGVTPRDIDAFLSALRNHPLFRRDFASAELTGIKRSQGSRTVTAGATFTIVCVPKRQRPCAKRPRATRKGQNDSDGNRRSQGRL